MKIYIYVLGIISFFFISSCAVTPVHYNARNHLDNFKETNTSGLLYIIRKDKGESKFMTKIHYIDTVSVGYLGYGDGYLVVALTQGKHVLKLLGDGGISSEWYEKKFTIKAGEKLTIEYPPLDVRTFKEKDIEGKVLGQFSSLLED